MRTSSHLKSSLLEPTERTTSICTSFGMDINEASDRRLVRRFAGISICGRMFIPEGNTVNGGAKVVFLRAIFRSTDRFLHSGNLGQVSKLWWRTSKVTQTDLRI